MDNKNLKIGILTFHKSINYGSVLQAWALQKALKKLGYESEIIDYEPKEYKHIYELRLKDAKGFKRIIKILLSFRKCVEIQHNKFRNFRESELKTSSVQYEYDSDVSGIQKKYSVLVTGSDQIWNTNISDCDPIFFLPFYFEGGKIAYACSINNGTTNDRFQEDWLKKWLNDYDFISVRERSGVNKLSQFLGGERKIYSALDPTLLHLGSVYEKLIHHRLIEGKYIFLYNMWTKNEGIKAAKIVSKKLNLPVYTISNQIDLIRVAKYEANCIKLDVKHTGPKDFLNYIYHADFILTDSFHGTAFSVIFNKRFLTLNSRISKNEYKNDERLVSILEQLELVDRFVKLDDIPSFDLYKEIDYERINSHRLELASNSLKMLNEAIEGCIEN